MQRTSLYCVFLLFSSKLWAYPEGYFYQESFLPQKSEVISHTKISYQLDDFDLEDEISDQDIDDIDREQNAVQQSFVYGLNDKTSVLAGLSYVFRANRSRKYDQDIDLLEMRSDYDGLEFLEAGVVHRPDHLDSQGVEQTVVFKVRSGLSRGADDKASLGGVDARASYLFNFVQSWGGFAGSLNAHYFGKKKLKRVDKEVQETMAYSAFSLWIGPRWEWGRFYYAAMGGFGLTTDFVIKSPSYNRSSDSGFLTRAAMLTGYDFGPWGLELAYEVGSDVFNKSGEDRVGDEIDFELETSKASLVVLWKF